MPYAFTPVYRGGSGPPLVCLHGFTDTWRTWELVLPHLERHHDVLAPTLAGHAGGPPLEDPVSDVSLADAVEAAMDAAGFTTAHLVGNSLGGYVALQMAARGRARSVVAFAPPGGWPEGADWASEVLHSFATMQEQLRLVAPRADALVATAEGRRMATARIVTHSEHLPPQLIAHLLLGVVGCTGLEALVALALRDGYRIDAEHVSCPVRVVWGTDDALLPWPAAATRYREEWLPDADWVELEGVGHSPQLDVPLEAAQLVLGFTGGA